MDRELTENYDFMTERLTEDHGEAFSPSRYSLKSEADAILAPYRTYELFFEITFHVLQKLGTYEDIGTPEECRKGVDFVEFMKNVHTCHDCGHLNCRYDPDPGQMVRYNCPLWEPMKAGMDWGHET